MVSTKVSTKQLISRLSKNTLYLSLISFIGVLLSSYTLYVELSHKNNTSFDALCDINEHISCSKVFLSKYGKGFGVLPKPLDLPNPVFGLIYYFLQLILANISNNSLFMTKFYTFNAIIANFGSIYLSYILVFVLKNLCIVCVLIYLINFVMFFIAINRYKLITSYKRYKKD